jgi:acyl-CoA thioesterase FadM
MYPYLRALWVHLRPRTALTLEGESILPLRVMPWDADVYPEMNNGRHLTLMDLGRFDFARRAGLLAMAKREGWSFVVGGASIRFNRRLRPGSRFQLRTRLLGHDRHWFYFHQTTESRGRLCSGALVRAGLCTRGGMVEAERVLAALGAGERQAPLPDWVRDWIAADALRPEAAGRDQSSTGS